MAILPTPQLPDPRRRDEDCDTRTALTDDERANLREHPIIQLAPYIEYLTSAQLACLMFLRWDIEAGRVSEHDVHNTSGEGRATSQRPA